VSFGAQTRMNGINMLTACVLAVTPDVPRVIGVAQPGRGRASRATRVGDLAFIIGVRGHENPRSKIKAIQEVPEAFDVQLVNCFDTLEDHMSKFDMPLDSIIRADTALRDVSQAERYRDYVRGRFDGKVPFVGFSVGTILGGRCEQEIGVIAAAPGVERDTLWLANEPTRAESIKTGDLLFIANSSGLTDGICGPRLRDLYGDLAGQVRQSLDNIDAALTRRNSGLDRLLRLDLFLRDIYSEQLVIDVLRDVLGKDMPVLNLLGTDPEGGADIEIAAIAGS
jgi:enamine deaminase RidA (YjgF/YER057c/UK114 family)